jgi:hypothetical protein
MSKLLGGIFSRPSGQTSGLVFGAGRTSRGKKVTVRELVIPANPRSNAQVTQRNRFTFALGIVKAIGENVYSYDWNRAVKQLPGFQSLMSVMTLALTSGDGTLDTPPSTTLGARHFPSTFAAVAGVDQIDVSWSSESGDLGAATDKAVIIAVATDPVTGETTREVLIDQSTTRADGAAVISSTGVAAGDFQVGLYFTSEEVGIPANDKKSEAQWVELT